MSRWIGADLLEITPITVAVFVSKSGPPELPLLKAALIVHFLIPLMSAAPAK